MLWRILTPAQVHIVHFDSADKITQIRQYWDQGSLLKQIDVIGARSRNWPIREGSEQAKLIKSSAQVAQPDSAPSSRPSTATRGADEVSIRSRGSTNNAMNDPHASLSLFERHVFTSDGYPDWYKEALMVHELAHQWYGDSVTPRTPASGSAAPWSRANFAASKRPSTIPAPIWKKMISPGTSSIGSHPSPFT